MKRLDTRFRRSEPRRRARAYVRGLFARLERKKRKNGRQIAEAAGDATPDGVPDFLARSQRDADAIRDDLRGLRRRPLWCPDRVLVLDETGFEKKGTKSVGVRRP